MIDRAWVSSREYTSSRGEESVVNGQGRETLKLFVDPSLSTLAQVSDSLRALVGCSEHASATPLPCDDVPQSRLFLVALSFDPAFALSRLSQQLSTRGRTSARRRRRRRTIDWLLGGARRSRDANSRTSQQTTTTYATSSPSYCPYSSCPYTNGQANEYSADSSDDSASTVEPEVCVQSRGSVNNLDFQHFLHLVHSLSLTFSHSIHRTTRGEQWLPRVDPLRPVSSSTPLLVRLSRRFVDLVCCTNRYLCRQFDQDQ